MLMLVRVGLSWRDDWEIGHNGMVLRMWFDIWGNSGTIETRLHH